jgi:LAO/AO transport system kinase
LAIFRCQQIPRAAGIIKTLHERPAQGDWVIPVLKTNASAYEGIEELLESIHAHSKTATANHRLSLIAERAYRLIQHGRMKDVNVKELKAQLESVFEEKDFNLYQFVKKII